MLPGGTLLVGHTHHPFTLLLEDHRIVNPGSLGQPKHGIPEACYAVWQDGEITLRSYSYPLAETRAKILAMPVADGIRRGLARVLLNASGT